MAAELAPNLRSVESPPTASRPARRSAALVLSGLWPTAGGVLLALVLWQLVVWSGCRAQYPRPRPGDVMGAELPAGIDKVPPQLIPVGRARGADGLRLYRNVVLPAALPAFVGGLKQGWAFAWRSLMSAELLVGATNQTSIGQQLQAARNLPDARQLLALMIVIFAVGIVIDSLFGSLEGSVKQR